jgi:hypothetical protein
VFYKIGYVVVRCLGRLYFVIALLFHRFVCYFMKNSVSIDLVVIYGKFCSCRLGCRLTENSVSVDLVVVT